MNNVASDGEDVDQYEDWDMEHEGPTDESLPKIKSQHPKQGVPISAQTHKQLHRRGPPQLMPSMFKFVQEQRELLE